MKMSFILRFWCKESIEVGYIERVSYAGLDTMPKTFKFLVILIFVLNAIALLEPLKRIVVDGAKPDEVVAFETKLNEIKALIPPNEVVGYVADGEVTKNGQIRLEDCRLFYMTQYSMAPHIVMHETGRNFVVGNFSSPAEGKKTVRELGLEIIKDCENGIMLLRGKTKK